MTYLIATSLPEFLPPKSPVVMMGPWCLSALGVSHNNELHQGKMLPCPWQSHVELEKASVYVHNTYLDILVILSRALNEIHGVDYSKRYWEILLGTWLCDFTNVVYDRLKRLQLAKGTYSDLKLIGLSPNDFVIPFDTLGFCEQLNSDIYNLQLITRLAEYMGINVDFHEKLKSELDNVVQNNGHSKISNNLFRKLKCKMVRAYKYIEQLRAGYADVVFYCSYHPRWFLMKLFVLSGGKMIDIDIETPMQQQLDLVKRDDVLRDNLSENLLKYSHEDRDNFLEAAVLKILAYETPQVFLEGYTQLANMSDKKFSKFSPKAIFSSVGWYFDEPFKFWCANSVNQGVKLFGAQHGGNYGIEAYMQGEEHEISITDKYFTWGWTKKPLKETVLPTPSQKFIGMKKRSQHVKFNDKGILFITMSPFKYLRVFPAVPEYSIIALQWQKIFLENIDEIPLSIMRLRPHYHDCYLEFKKNLQKKLPRLKFETWERSFRESLNDCRLFVCDHISTTYVESLASNVPTVIFCDKEINKFRDEAQPFFDDLRKVGILHDTPESAAAWVNKIYPDVSSWWQEEDCQRAVNNFCYNYGRTSKRPVREWLDILKSAL